MEKEAFFSGYCRQLDSNRMVEVIADNGQLLEVDCCYEGCIYAPNCTVAEKIGQLLRETASA